MFLRRINLSRSNGTPYQLSTFAAPEVHFTHILLILCQNSATGDDVVDRTLTHRTIEIGITALKEQLMRTIPLIAGLLLSAGTSATMAQDAPESMRTPAPEGAEVYIQSPADGETVTSPVTIRFGLRGLGVAPAGIQFPASGHHHVLIDVGEDDMPSFDLPLPTTDQVVHFGLGQTEAVISMEPGQHTLQLVVGDHLHTPHLPPIVSEVIFVTVAE